MRGEGQLNELAANYYVHYDDGSKICIPVRRRHHIGAFSWRWGENCFQAVEHHKPYALLASHEQTHPNWGESQTRVSGGQFSPWINWLYAWENPFPDKEILSFTFHPVSGVVIVSGISVGNVTEIPIRWRKRQKILLSLNEPLDRNLNVDGNQSQIQLDLGQIISISPRLSYPTSDWPISPLHSLPDISKSQYIIEYTSHPDACFHLKDGSVFNIQDAEKHVFPDITPVQPAYKRVRLRIVDSHSHQIVAVRLHIHGLAGEYLPPVDRHRIINPAWFEDYSIDFSHRGIHPNTYVDGDIQIDLPIGKIYLEITKGFEVQPIRQIIEINEETNELVIEVNKVLNWREKGWVTADTHVHFLSPISALLEGAAEGVNVINLLASQWGELMTNVGDFDGHTTWGSQQAGGSGEYLVRVGTENRQHVLGHISLLGYQGRIIAPMTSGGPDESALGDPIDILLTEWAQKCHSQGGLVVLPHFPNPRAEHAASIINGDIDALEMTSWGDFYSGIDPYSISDWYRYLNCGYFVPAVGGTDKMSASTAVGTIRTYSRIPTDRHFTYESWMDAIKGGNTFVTYGPLLEFFVNGKPCGSRLYLPENGGTVDINWSVSSVTIPVTRVELIINGEIKEAKSCPSEGCSGSWSVSLERSSWLALLVRGKYVNQTEMISAHSSPIMIEIDGSSFFSGVDAVTILDQIEGSLAYLDVIGTRASEINYKRMRLLLTSTYRSLHNRLHKNGFFHEHSFMPNEI